MNTFEPIGYLASLLVLATFCMRDMVALRAVAIASNFAFIAYGALADVLPVLLLHVVLLPVNLLRLAESVRALLRYRAAARRLCNAAALPSDAKPAIATRWRSGSAPPARSLRRAAGAATPRRSTAATT